MCGSRAKGFPNGARLCFTLTMTAPVSRRRFLTSASVATVAAAASTLPAFAEPAEDKAPPPEPFKLVPAAEFAKSAESLATHPGNFNFFDGTRLPVTAVMTVEEKHAAKEFEWHEGRDHLLQVIEGTTVYEVGGTPQGAHNTRPGEWLAPSATGATTLTLHKGDWLIIPRNTLHKRTTEGSVTFFLISTVGALVK